jgi:hypothetical protein
MKSFWFFFQKEQLACQNGTLFCPRALRDHVIAYGETHARFAFGMSH